MTKREHTKLIRESFDNAKKSGLKMNAIIISTGCCDECLKLNEMQIPFEEAEKNPPIPYKKCTRKWGCNCTIGFQTLRDENDNLITQEY